MGHRSKTSQKANADQLVKLRQVGGSKGVLIPRAIINSLHLDMDSQFSIRAEGNSIVLGVVNDPHKVFRDYFKKNPNAGKEDEFLMGDFQNEFDKNEPPY